MQVIIKINDRQALPVRAIPLLTDWHGLSPDGLAQILAGDSDHWPSFDGLTAHRLHSDGSIEAIPPRWWVSWVVGELEATSNTIKAKETSRATGRQQWRRESLAQLPAGVFVWRDEFEAAHSNEYRPDGRRARSNPEGFDPSAHALDFNPNPNPLIAPAPLVMEGFEPLIAPPGSRNLEHLWFVRGCYGAGDNDTHWLGLKSLSPHEAAALLCGRDPLVQRGCDEQCVVLLERRLTDYNESHPARRSWREWHGVAKEIEAEYEKGFDALFAELAQTPNTSTAGAPAQPQAAPPAPLADSASNAKPWLSIDQQDPTPAQPWYTPARYFARQLTMETPALLANRKRLADRVATALFNAGFKKRGGKLRFDSGTVLKALTNVTLG